MTSLRAFTAAFVTVGTLAACGGQSQPAAHPQPQSAARDRVEIGNFSYHPPTITVQAGTKIAFTNSDQTDHTATATNGAFDTGTIGHGATRTLTFTKPGVYTYYCQFHAFMRGEIIVK